MSRVAPERSLQSRPTARLDSSQDYVHALVRFAGPRRSSAMFRLRVLKRVACTRAAPLFGLRHSIAGGLSADYHEFGNDGQSEEAGPTAPTTGKPCDIIKSST
jgi:hypothetical protein